MTRKCHTEEQIIAALKEAQVGVSVLVYSTREVPEQHRTTGRRGMEEGAGQRKPTSATPAYRTQCRDWQAS
jgi:hypothetical protein